MPRFVFVKPSLPGPPQRDRFEIDSLLAAAEAEGYTPYVALTSRESFETHYTIIDLDRSHVVHSIPDSSTSSDGEATWAEPVSIGHRVITMLGAVGRIFSRPQSGTHKEEAGAANVSTIPEVVEERPAAILEVFQSLAAHCPLDNGDIVFADVSPGELAEMAGSFKELTSSTSAHWHLVTWRHDNEDSAEELTVEQTKKITELALTQRNVCLYADSSRTAEKIRGVFGLNVGTLPVWRKPAQKTHTVGIMGTGKHDCSSLHVVRLLQDLNPTPDPWRVFNGDALQADFDTQADPELLVYLPDWDETSDDMGLSLQLPVPTLVASNLELAKAAARQIVAYHLQVFDRDCFVGSEDLSNWLVDDADLSRSKESPVPHGSTHALVSLESPEIDEWPALTLSIRQFDASRTQVAENWAVFAASDDLATTLVRVHPEAVSWQLTRVSENWHGLVVRSATIDFMQFGNDLPLTKSAMVYDATRGLVGALEEVLSHWDQYARSRERAMDEQSDDHLWRLSVRQIRDDEGRCQATLSKQA